MFENTALKNHFETSPTVQLRANIVAEWNMNMPDNIFKLGNYRYRPQNSPYFITLQPFSLVLLQLYHHNVYMGKVELRIHLYVSQALQ